MTERPLATCDPLSWLCLADWIEEFPELHTLDVVANSSLWRWRGNVGRLLLQNTLFGVWYPTQMGRFPLGNGWTIRLRECKASIMVDVITAVLGTARGSTLVMLEPRTRWKLPVYGNIDPDYYRRRIWQLADRIAEAERLKNLAAAKCEPKTAGA